MSYGTPNYRTEATMFDLYDDSASAVLAEESGNCHGLDVRVRAVPLALPAHSTPRRRTRPSRATPRARCPHGGVRGWLQHVARDEPPRVHVVHGLRW